MSETIDKKSLKELIDQAFHVTGPDALKGFLHELVERVESEKAARDQQMDRIEAMLAKLQPLIA